MKKLFLILIFTSYFGFSQESILNNNFKYKDIFEWDKTMKFVFVPNSKDFTLYRYNNKIYGKQIEDSFFENKPLNFSSIETYPKNSENCKYICIVFDFENNKYAYKIEVKSLEKFKKTKILQNIPNLIYYDDYLKAVSIFLEKYFYIKDYINFEYKKIYIKNVTLNDDVFPVTIFYSNSEFKLTLSGINKRYELFCNYRDNCIENFNYNTLITVDEYNLIQEKKKQIEINEKIKNDSLIILERKKYYEKEMLEWKLMKDSCFYRQNNLDEITGKKIKKTYFYDLLNPSIHTYDDIAISLEKRGNDIFIIFKSKKELGCVSPYNDNKSSVKIKFTDNSIETFYHIGNLDCDYFYLISKISLQKLNSFKNKKIKFIRLDGTQFYDDIYYIKFDDFFNHIPNCIK